MDFELKAKELLDFNYPTCKVGYFSRSYSTDEYLLELERKYWNIHHHTLNKLQVLSYLNHYIDFMQMELIKNPTLSYLYKPLIDRDKLLIIEVEKITQKLNQNG